MTVLQRIFESLRFAWKAIRSNRQRSLLTMLGVGTGIFAITGILTMVNSLQVSVTAGLESLGNTVFFVHNWPWAEETEDWYQFFNRPRMSYGDFLALENGLNGVEGIMFQATARGQMVQANGNSATGVEVNGQTEGASVLGAWALQAGRPITQLEYYRGASVAVLGINVAESLFPGSSAVGQYFRVGGKRMLVVGVMERRGQGLVQFGASDDDKVFIPFQKFGSMYALNSRGIDKVIAVKAKEYDNLEFVEQETIGLIRSARGLSIRQDNTFSINKQEALMSRFEDVFRYLRIGGIVISIFSVLIGGFSIGNIMYISVRERTNEIGVQKALGSARGFILSQFLTEALMLCIMGGMIGIAFVGLIGVLVQAVLGTLDLALEVSFSIADLLTGMAVAAFIGLVAGTIPALMASKLDPVEAIRM